MTRYHWRVWCGRYSHTWFASRGKGYPASEQFSTWREAFDYAYYMAGGEA